MHQGVKWMVAAFGSAVLLAGAVYAASAWRGASPAQRAALEAMQRPAPLPGRNAFAAMTLLRYGLDEADLAALEQPGPWQGLATGTARAGVPPGFERQLAGHAEAFEPQLDRAPCRADAPCLAAVEADPAAAAGWVASHRDWIGRVERLSGYGHIASPVPGAVMLYAAWGDMGIALRNDRAVRFVQGSPEQALSQVCRDIGHWRGLAAHSESLLAQGTAWRVADGQMALFAQMLERWPADARLPGACTAALAPPSPAEQSTCTAMRGEYRLTTATRAAIDEQARGNAAGLFYRADMTDALTAHVMHEACEEPRRRPTSTRADLMQALRLDCVRNLVGCTLMDAAAPVYSDFRLRAHAFADRVRLAATLAWLHDTGVAGISGPQPLAERLEARPEPLRGTGLVAIVADGAALEVASPDAAAAPFRLPLPRHLRD